jgi:ABC-2 type transport system permease protein
MRGVRAVAVKELRQIARDRRTLVTLIFLPAFFLFLYGYALNFDVRHVRLAVEDRDHSQESRALIADFARSTYFDIVAAPASTAEASALLDRNRARAVLVIPTGFARTLEDGRSAEVQVILDGDNANTASTVLGYVNAVLRSAPARLSPGAGRIARIEPRIWYNPELRSTVFLVPGLIAFISMITAVVSTALSIVKEKERGTIEQVRMAPLSTLSFIVGKTLPYLLLSQIGAMSIVVAAIFLFGLPMRGSWLALSVVVALFLVGALGTGLLISTIAHTQQVAFQAAALAALLPTLILSGFIFPIASMPVPLQYISAVVPARYFLIALRGIVLKGLPIETFWAPILALVAYAAVTLGVSAIRLRRS